MWTWETSIEDWKMLIRWCRTDICSCKLSAKVSLMLDNPFLVPSLCKLNHISVCFIQISTKSSASSLFPSGKTMFFWSHPRCFGPFGKFQHNIKISIKTARVSRLSVSCDSEKLSRETFSRISQFLFFFAKFRLAKSSGNCNSWKFFSRISSHFSIRESLFSNFFYYFQPHSLQIYKVFLKGVIWRVRKVHFLKI